MLRILLLFYYVYIGMFYYAYGVRNLALLSE